MKDCRLIIFDLDGTLLDTLGDLAASCNRTMESYGYPTFPLERYRMMVGNGITKLIERALPEDCRTPDHIMEVRRRFIGYYQAHLADFTRPYEGIPQLLSELRRRGIALAVASNKYQEGTRMLIERFFGGDMFSAVMGQCDGRAVKPDPQIVRDILSVTGISADRTLYVGDSSVDMQTAANASLESVGVTWGFRSREELEASGAVHIVDRPEEILMLVG